MGINPHQFIAADLLKCEHVRIRTSDMCMRYYYWLAQMSQLVLGNNMWWRRICKLLKAGVFAALLAFVGVMGFCYFSGDYDAFIVLSDSMQPAIKSGDLVFVGKPNRPFVNEIKPGAIVTYQHNEGLVTHRVVSVTGDTLVTQGDAMEGPDPWPVSRFYDVKGSYIARIPYVGNLNAFIRTRTGWFVAIILPAIFLLTLIIKEIVKEALKKEKTIKEVIWNNWK